MISPPVSSAAPPSPLPAPTCSARASRPASTPWPIERRGAHHERHPKPCAPRDLVDAPRPERCQDGRPLVPAISFPVQSGRKASLDGDRDATGPIVYLPTYRIPALDRAATDSYTALGYCVVPIDVSTVYTLNGSLGCLVNVMARG